ncbi:pyridoxamine 5'-phosphate oxidase family protein [Tropicimonas sp. TH_r6]|uniref:pyridoxamine 5'-phosphate oxidase family protein n=1 Tax=Tropicimonas sp. TH_r6 TaxID=3082085 RepID=UPI002954AA29|nr:pyridoxamine 5'-phosphate oxidase family protein [Tropicimonas sp. TH_r6]MDV7143805.1 pyridoxamine 5'-phosphate oxidase family protein [Tropicimonas sp. TH_r6]
MPTSPITDLDTLDQIYGPAIPSSVDKVVDHITPLYRQWIEAARFAILTTVGPEGTDASPRGDVEPVLRVADPGTLLLPDWRGNNRIDSLRNIVRDPRVSLLFLVPGCNNVVRVNGRAIVTADPDMLDSFDQNGQHPRTVIVISVEEAYFQCAKALMRSRLWSRGDESDSVPTAGAFIRARDDGFDAEGYDTGYADYARDRMW